MEVPLLEGEALTRTQTASVDGKSIWGGQLVLTNQRLLFQPLDMKVTTKLLNDGIEFLPGNLAVFGEVVSKALDYTTGYQGGLTGTVPTTSIVSVGSGKGPGLLHPPSLVLTLDSGTRVEIGILTGRFSPNISSGNAAARDEMIQLIRAQLASGGLA